LDSLAIVILQSWVGRFFIKASGIREGFEK
jgi:hypothetical protein